MSDIAAPQGGNMTDLFSSYYRLTAEEFDQLWIDCFVVFDTNALLDIYKYPLDAQKDMLRAMKAVESRLLLPHQVALEFNRHRLGVIADQVETFDKVAEIVKNTKNTLVQKLQELQLVKLHSLIDPTDLTKTISDAADEFLENLEQLKGKQRKVHEPDELREELDLLFAGKVVGGFPDQAALDLWGTEAEERFASQIPPGFEDARDKTKDGIDLEFSFNGLRYKNKYGDYFLWRQVLEAVKARGEPTNLILITNESKPDWWNEIRSQGKHKVGVHPNLIEEYKRNSQGGHFHIYNNEGFLIEAKKRLKVSLTKNTVTRVRDIAEANTELESEFSPWMVESTFFYMLRTIFPGVWVERRSYFPAFIVNASEESVGFDIKYLRRPQSFHIFPIVEKTAQSVERYRQAGRFDHFELSFIVASEEHAKAVSEGVEATKNKLEVPFEIGIYTIVQGDSERFPHLSKEL